MFQRISIRPEKKSKKQKADQELDKLFAGAFERNVLGTLDDECYARMTATYESEQKELMESVAESEQTLSSAEQENVDLRTFLSVIRQCTDIQELTPALVNHLISKIEIFDSYKDENRKKRVPVKIHFVAFMLFSLPMPNDTGSAGRNEKCSKVCIKTENGTASIGAVPYPTYQLSLADSAKCSGENFAQMI